jgi:parallel beta-helix repeat protein
MKPSVFIAASSAGLSGMLFFGTGLAQATDISGPISVTKMISTNSRLTGDVTCTVTTGPCIQFKAPGIKLKLNGFTMTGNGGRDSCTPNFAEAAIDTNAQNNVSIEGPGLVTRFNGDGILVSGNNSSVEGVAITSSCINGIQVAGSHNEVEGNSVSRASLGGGFFAGIFVSGSGNHTIRINEVVGAGPYPITSSQAGHGIFVGEPGAPSINNLIEANDVSGNPGAGIVFKIGSTGNTVRHNQALGNVFHNDVFDENALPANTYDNNLCEVSSIGTSAANICKLPNIAGHHNGNPDGD